MSVSRFHYKVVEKFSLKLKNIKGSAVPRGNEMTLSSSLYFHARFSLCKRYWPRCFHVTIGQDDGKILPSARHIMTQVDDIEVIICWSMSATFLATIAWAAVSSAFHFSFNFACAASFIFDAFIWDCSTVSGVLFFTSCHSPFTSLLYGGSQRPCTTTKWWCPGIRGQPFMMERFTPSSHLYIYSHFMRVWYRDSERHDLVWQFLYFHSRLSTFMCQMISNTKFFERIPFMNTIYI